MSEMTKPDSRVIDFSFYQKKKFYNEFHAIVYKEFNKSISDINNSEYVTTVYSLFF